MITRSATVALAVAFLCAPALPASADPPMQATGTRPALSIGSMHEGGYVGATAGRTSAALKAPEAPALSDEGLFGGAYIGYGITAQGIYVGLELDAMLRDIKPTVTDGTTTITISNRWLASARARVGMPIGPALIYGTGGIAMQESVLKLTDLGLNAKDQAYVLGLVLGAGIEAQITSTMHVRLEGLHYAWRDETFQLAGEAAKIGQADTVIRIGVGFKLGN